jgi:hypothetical protein
MKNVIKENKKADEKVRGYQPGRIIIFHAKNVSDEIPQENITFDVKVPKTGENKILLSLLA